MVVAAQVQRSQPHSQRQLAQLQLRRRHSRRQLVPLPLQLLQLQLRPRQRQQYQLLQQLQLQHQQLQHLVIYTGRAKRFYASEFRDQKVRFLPLAQRCYGHIVVRYRKRR